MSAIGMAWISIRNYFFPSSFIEDYVVYAQGVLSILNLFMSSAVSHRQNLAKSNMAVTLTHLVLIMYATVDSYDTYVLDYYDMPPPNTTLDISTCCPNSIYAEWNKQFYFGGFDLFLAPAAISVALQVVHVLIAAGGLLNTQDTLNPGISLPFSLFVIAIAVMNIRFLGFTTLPCIADSINLFDGFIHFKIRFLLIVVSGGLMLFAAAEDFLSSTKIKYLWSIVGMCFLGFYFFVIFSHIYGYNMVSYPWIAINGLAVVTMLFCIYSAFTPETVLIQEKAKTRTRFVVPIQPNLSQAVKRNKEE